MQTTKPVKNKLVKKQAEIAMLNDSDIINKRFFISFCSVIGSSLIMLLVGFFLSRLPNPVNYTNLSKVYFLIMDDFKPERPESLIYMSLTVLFPVLFILFYSVLNKLHIGPRITRLCKVLYPAGFLFYTAGFYVLNTHVDFYQSFNSYYYDPMLIVFVSMLTVFLIYLFESSQKRLRTVFNNFGLVICILLSLFIASFYVTASYSINYVSFFHFDAYYYPVFEVFNGKTLIHDFNNIYGFYPYLIVPILKLTGSISILKFSVVVAVMVLIVLLSLLGVVWLNVKNKVLALMGFFALAFFTIILPLVVTPGYYLQYQPHRLLFPALIVLVCTFKMRVKRPAASMAVTIAGYVLSCLSLLWNIDTGIVVVAAWFLFLSFNCAMEYTLKNRRLYSYVLKNLVFSALSVLSAYLILVAITYLRSGEIATLSKCLEAQKLFYGTGYFMLPMPLEHPWILLIMVYMVALMKSLRSLKFLKQPKETINKSRASVYFILAIVGLGIFSYYQGRSHDDVFTAITWPGILISILLAQEAFEKLMLHLEAKKQAKTTSKIVFITDLSKTILILLFLISFAAAIPFQVVNNQTLSAIAYKDNFYDGLEIDYNITTIRDNIGDKKNVDLFIEQADYYYTQLGLKNPTDLSSHVDWFTRADYNKALEWLNTTQDDVVFDDSIFNSLQSYDYVRINEIVENRFTLMVTEQGYTFYSLKKD